MPGACGLFKMKEEEKEKEGKQTEANKIYLSFIG